MLKRSILWAGLAGFALTTDVGAQTFETSAFIGSPTNFVGFEGLGTDFYPGIAGYTEDGVTVRYVGAPGLIWTGYTASIGGDGLGWYPNAGSTGYTSIRFANGQDFDALQFLIGSGYSSGQSNLAFQLMNDGSPVLTGPSLPFLITHPMQFVGFSGGGFDEVRLQALFGSTTFSPTNFEAAAIDSISARAAAVAVPGPIAGAGLPVLLAAAGFWFWRRRRVA